MVGRRNGRLLRNREDPAMRSNLILAVGLAAGLVACDAFAAPASAQFRRTLRSSYGTYAPYYSGYSTYTPYYSSSYSGYATPYYVQPGYSGGYPVHYGYSTLYSPSNYSIYSAGYASPYTSTPLYSPSTPYYSQGWYSGTYLPANSSVPYVYR
jgi:hypothetical protein